MNTLKTNIVFTANRLLDGEVVWLSSNGQWVDTIEAAHAVKTEGEQASFAAQAAKSDAENVVVEPYEIDVEIVGGTIVPVRFREKIRATGPTIRLDLGKQANVAAHAA